MNLQERLENIRQSYGSKGLELRAVATEEIVHAFEECYRVRLPEAYYRFVIKVGNGGDGPPHYGMFPVEDADHDELGRVYEGFAPRLEFPLREA